MLSRQTDVNILLFKNTYMHIVYVNSFCHEFYMINSFCHNNWNKKYIYQTFSLIYIENLKIVIMHLHKR